MGETPEEETADARPEGDAAEPPDPGATEAERLSRKERAIRRRVLLSVAPLALTLFIPWKAGFAWEMNERVVTSAFVAIPLLTLGAALVGLAKKRSLLVRSLLLGAFGLALLTMAHELLTAPWIIRQLASDIRRLDAYALYLGFGGPLIAVTMELFAALERRSRPRALLAGAGWAALVLGFFVPMRSDRVESMPFLMMTELVDDARREPMVLLLTAPMAILLFVAAGNAALTILRLVGDAAQRERWRPRSGCFAIGLGVLPPLAILIVFTVGAVIDEIEWLGSAIDGSLFALGLWVGIPSLLAAGLDGLATTARLAAGRGEPGHVKRARIGVGVLGALGVVWCLTPVATGLLPDGRADRAGEALAEVADAVVASASGEEIDPRFLGGYSEFDLRGSRDTLGEAVGDAPTELVYATFEIVVSGPSLDATVVVGVDSEGDLDFIAGRRSFDTRPTPGMSRRAAESLADLAELIHERLGSVTCLPASAPPDLATLEHDPESLSRLCSPIEPDTDRRRRISDLADGADVIGGTGRYRLWMRVGGETFILEGRLYTHEGRLWIGKATILIG